MSSNLIDFAPEVEVTPKGWEPYSEQTGQIGSAIVKLPRPDATKRDLLLSAGFSPDEWAIKGDIQVRRWMRSDQEWLHYYRFDVVAGIETDEQRKADIAELAKRIRRPRERKPVTGEDAWLYVASDWQLGKGEGDGSRGTVDRVVASIEQAVVQVKALRRVGRAMPTGVIAGTGDLGEGTCGFFPSQPFVTDLNRRDQNRLTRMLLQHAIQELRPLFDEFTVLSVAGNHGENRQNMKKATDDADNDDVAQFECVREAFDLAAASGHDWGIDWVIPDDELSILHTLGGVPVGFTHGHLVTSGGKLAQAKALEWWKGQVFGLQAVAAARLLISSHFHHFSVVNHGARTHFQTPAMDPGSKWVRDAWGADSPAGVLTLRIDATEPLGWADLSVLGGRSVSGG